MEILIKNNIINIIVTNRTKIISFEKYSEEKNSFVLDAK